MQGNITIALLLVVATVSSLKCWNNPYGYVMATTNNSTLIDCIGLAYSCVKVVDYTTGIYSKGCNMANCSQPNQNGIYSDKFCYSNGSPRYAGDTVHNITSCCCYGDGCNSATHHMVGGLMTVVLSYVFM